MLTAGAWVLLGAGLTIVHASYSHSSPELTDAFIREMLDRMGSDLADPGRGDYLDILPQSQTYPLEGMAPRAMEKMPAPPMALDYDALALSPSIRDQEYLSHSSLLSTMNNNYDGKPSKQRPKPGSETVKTNTDVLPAYCNPPNPCPIGYTAANGCLEEFENTAGFSREYQGRQDCMCDTEHMFECPDSSQESEISALAGSIQNEGVLDSALDMIMYKLGTAGHHPVAKKFHESDEPNYNPYLMGEKLPVAAKKGVPL
ncbi:neuroendocrine protein 7B2 [Palaemon carinicauda]|uniref:neuroendocrine protein 7B2 n=1 Tax=Palaemon carinicauda TaxID=392227 RepID=UPI0035B6702C